MILFDVTSLEEVGFVVFCTVCAGLASVLPLQNLHPPEALLLHPALPESDFA